MQYTISELARLAGVTKRTLHHYDAIGLLRPGGATESGYRLYGPAEVDRLQQVLFYRELGVALGDIACILDGDGYDAAAALQGHLEKLEAQRARLNTLIRNAHATLHALQGGRKMNDTEKFEGFKRRLVAENEEKYGAEVRQSYGDDAADAANRKMMNMTQEDYAAFQALEAELKEALGRAVATGDAAGEDAQRAAALHKQWLCCTWASYSPEAHKNLADMYVADERFAAYYNAVAPGAAQMLRDAIHIYCGGAQ